MARTESSALSQRWPLGADDARTFQRTAIDLLIRLHIVDKIAKIHDPNNDAFREQLRLLHGSLERILAEEKEATFRVRHGAFILNGARLRSSFGTYPLLKSLMTEFRERDLDALRFKPGLTLDELRRFMPVFARREKRTGSAFAQLQTDVDEAGVVHVELERATPFKTTSTLNRNTARLVFLGIAHLKDSFRRNARNEGLKVPTTRRLIQSIYNHIVDNESFVFGMTNLKNYDEYTLNHSVNVCLLAMALGRRLGLNRGELVDLGIAAFFHDLGKIDTPLEILNKPSRLDAEEREIMERHPFKGAEKLVLLKESRRLPLQAIHVSMEHHIKPDRGGYPRSFRPADVNLFSRIVKVVDYFDAITTKRVYRQDTFTRAEALSLMLELGGTEFHPVILKAFVHMMGTFPIGSLVGLRSGEIGVVFELAEDPQLALRPKVKLITDADGNKIDGAIVDLADRDRATGRFLRSIAGPLDPGDYGVEVAGYFLAEALQPG
ncbi:MAG: HD domain-containing protein [Candidatus Aminicenantes bacterium]|nr:HD domain-containing protein [Candidatus Aminicenantes bacterium]